LIVSFDFILGAVSCFASTKSSKSDKGPNCNVQNGFGFFFWFASLRFANEKSDINDVKDVY